METVNQLILAKSVYLAPKSTASIFSAKTSSPRPKKLGTSKDDCSVPSRFNKRNGNASKSGGGPDETLGQKGPLAWDTMVEGITRTNKLRYVP